MNAISRKQLLANRANAKKSTGPKTPEGKAASRENAIKHGLTATSVFFKGYRGFDHIEQIGHALDADLAEMFEELDPQGAEERFLASRIVMLRHRLDRAVYLETQEVNRFQSLVGKEEYAKAASICDAMLKFSRYERNLERSLMEAMEELMALQEARRPRPAQQNEAKRDKYALMDELDTLMRNEAIELKREGHLLPDFQFEDLNSVPKKPQMLMKRIS